jgi:hypothetical protein
MPKSRHAPDRENWLNHVAERCHQTSLGACKPPRWTPYRSTWRLDPLQVDDDPIDARWVPRYSKVALAACVLLMALSWKPATLSNAGVLKVLDSSTGEKSIATADFRASLRQEQLRQIRPDNYDLRRFPITQATESHWRHLLWTTAVVQPTEAFVRDSVGQLLEMMVRQDLSAAQVRTVDMAMRVGTQLYLTNPEFYSSFGQRFGMAIAQSSDPQWVAVSLSNLAKVGTAPPVLQSLTEQVKTRFPNWTANVHLQTTLRDVAEGLAPSPLPPLGDLLRWEIAQRQVHLYAVCQPDRDVLCRTVLKNRDGEFVRQADGKLWSVPLLLRSIHGLAWNFSRGQTPQGIYRIEGSVPQPDDEFFRAFGQFPLVNLFVPFEPGARQFLPGKAGRFTGSIEAYKKLLPPTWRNVWAMQQTYWAGKAGRNLFRIHGTGDAPDFFGSKGKDPDSYNWNPTIGCLSALELYTEKGELLDADMPKLLTALETVAGPKYAGYLVVVDVPGQPGEPIALEQLDRAIAQSGNARPVGNASPKPASATQQSQASSSLSQALPNPSRTMAAPSPTAKLAVKPTEIYQSASSTRCQ